MKRKELGIAIILGFLCCSVSFGIAPIGQPTSNLRKGWLSGGIDYSHSEFDLNAENITNIPSFSEGTIENIKLDMLLGKAGIGLADNWEVFAGLGAAQSSFCGEDVRFWGDSGNLETDKTQFDGDTSTIAQVGTKYTFYEKALWKAGIACQFTWLGLTGTFEENINKDGAPSNSGKADFNADLMVFQVAPGLSYQLSYGLSLYGGPLFQWINGKVDSEGKEGFLIDSKGSADVKEASSIGGWAGIHADIDIFTTLNVEYQLTGSSGTIGISFASKF